MYLSIRPEILPLVKANWRVEDETPMWRMLLEDASALPAAGSAFRLDARHLAAVQQLYSDGQRVEGEPEESPDFFFPYMLDHGVFFGVAEGEELVAAAGTHLVAAQEGVAAIGNVYTRRDRRGRGLAQTAVSAVVRELLSLGIPTIALNVKQSNAAAIRVYERLGFRRYCPFYEGVARRP
jgi:ribosomal protein S18 acetylase RimI-like enzyme